MSHQPPIPQASQSPYPIKEAPHHPVAETSDEGGTGAETAEASSLDSFAERLDDIGLDTKAAIGIGAVVGVGAIAAVAALLFSAFGKRDQETASRGAAKKTAAPRARSTRKAATAKPAAAKAASKSAPKAAARKPAAKADTAS